MGTTTIEDLVVQVSAEDLLTNALSAMQDSFKRFGDLADSIGGKLGESLSPAATAAGATAGVFEKLTEKVLSYADSLIHAPIESALAFEATMAKVGATTHLSGDGLLEFRDRLEDVAVASGQSAEALGRVTLNAAKLGLRGEDLSQFTETVAQFSTVAGVTSEQASKSFNTLRNVFSETVDAADGSLTQLASGLVALQGVSGATAGELADAISHVGSAAAVGFDPGFLAAIVAEMTKLGVAAEMAGPQLSLMFLHMNQSLTKVGALVGQTGEQFKKSMEEDANGALTKVLKTIGAMDSGVEQMSAATVAFGARGARTAVQLATHFDDLQKMIQLNSDATEKGTALQAKFAVVTETTAGVTKRMKETFSQIGEAIGSVFLPGLDAGTRGLLSFGVYIRDTIKESMEVVSVLAAVGAALATFGVVKGFEAGSLKAGLSVIKALFVDLTPMIWSAGQGMLSLSTYTGAARAAFLSLGGATVVLGELYLLVKLIPTALEGWKIIIDNVRYGLEIMAQKAKDMVGAVSGGSSLMENLGAIGTKFLDGITVALTAIGGAVGSLFKLAFDAAASLVTQLQKIPVISRGIPTGLADGLTAAGVIAEASAAKIGKSFGETFKGAVTTVTSSIKDFFSGETAESKAITADNAALAATMATVGATNQSYVKLRDTIRGMAGDISLTDDQLIQTSRSLGKDSDAWHEFGAAIKAGVSYTDALKLAQSEMGDQAAFAAEKAKLVAQGFTGDIDRLAKMPPIMQELALAAEKTGETIDRGVGDALIRLMKSSWELAAAGDGMTASQIKEKEAINAQMEAIQKANHVSDELFDAYERGALKLANLDKANKETAKSTIDLSKATAHAVEKTKPAFDEWAKTFEMKSKYITEMAKITETQISNAMKAIEGSIQAVSSSITGMAPVMKDLLDPTRNFSMFGNELQGHILSQFQLQAELVQQQKELNQENLESLRQKRAMTAAGVTATYRIKVDGTDPAMTSLVREVTDRLMLQATREGGELCCG